MEVTSSIFQSTCNSSRSRECLKIKYDGSAMISCTSFNTPSDPGELFELILCKWYAYRFTVNAACKGIQHVVYILLCDDDDNDDDD